MSDILTDAQVAEIEARANAATPGPWTTEAIFNDKETQVCAPSTEESGNPNMIGHFVDDGEDETQAQRDTLFAAAARTDIPRLCATLRHFAVLLKDTMCDAMECTCHEAYRCRNLIAPDCRYHDNLEQVAALAAWDGEKRDE